MTSIALGSLELAILLAVARLGEDAYGLGIRSDLSARTRHDYSVGAIYTTLERLEAKGLVASTMSEPQTIRGGRARRVFTVTTAGERALRTAQRVAESVWGVSGATIRPRLA